MFLNFYIELIEDANKRIFFVMWNCKRTKYKDPKFKVQSFEFKV